MWNQVYNPFGNAVLSTIAAALPVVTLLALIASNKVKAPIAAMVALLVAIAVAIVRVHDAGRTRLARSRFSARLQASSRSAGSFSTCSFSTGSRWRRGVFETLQTTIGSVTADRRLQLLLIAFSFGAFFEGASGFGTPVAVTGAILIGLGFSPLAASGLSLIANTAPVAYGALGTPIAGLASVTGLDPYVLGAMVGRQLPFFSLIVPFWLIWVFAGFRGMMQVWPAILVTGVSFAIPQFLISNFINPWIVDIGASLISMACLILFLKVWRRPRSGHRRHSAPATTRAATMPRAEAKGGQPKPDNGRGLVRAHALDHRLRRAAHLGHGLVQGSGQSLRHLELPGAGAAQPDPEGAARRGQADAGRRRILVHVADLYGVGHADCGDRIGLPDGLRAGPPDRRPMPRPSG